MNHTISLTFTNDKRWNAIVAAASTAQLSLEDYLKQVAYEAATTQVYDGGTP